ncbi:metallophosphoesterase [Algivirga pacifica]|uniref:Metallophosphoesterase n=2 Tax=Algivirga pacifica TaxID=1162670 RepID=A0ABP9D8N0_9BACT
MGAFLSHHYTYAQDRPPETKKQFTLFLIGDTGEEEGLPIIEQLAKMANNSKTNSMVVFLGDNLYPKGLYPKEHEDRERGERILDSQLRNFQEYVGEVYMIPGNHDWKKGRKDGWGQVIEQQRFVGSLDMDNLHYYPKEGCPGPEEIVLNDSLVLLLIDTQWMVHPWEKGSEEPCGAETEEDVIAQLEDLLYKHEDKQVIVAGHHPLYTYGNHGGKFSWKEHLFPLTVVKPYAYLPLPIVGSVYPIARKLGISPQDRSNFRYKYMIQQFKKCFQKHGRIVYVSGHEHALQYVPREKWHQVVSGAGSKASYVRRGVKKVFALDEKGFATLSMYQGGEVWADYFVVKEGETPRLVYTVRLYEKLPLPKKEPRKERDFPDSVTVLASTQYEAGTTKRKFFGDNYREVWNTPVKVPVFDLAREKGGLQIVKRGGGMQTKSLRLQAANGKQYVLRSIEKYPYKAIPGFLRQTVAEEVVTDQISASHPYAAFVLPPMARAAGVYHTNPKLFYLPDDPLLGEFRRDFGGQLYLFEERPDDDWREADYFGNSKKIQSTRKVLEKLQEDNDNHVDQLFVLRNRLFDMIIGDWDRHDDQWRWASFKEKKGKLYRPIPRDRDQAFFVNEGIIPSLASQKWALPKIEGFAMVIKWPAGFNTNARFFDRSFLQEPDRQDWLNMADTLQQLLSDSVIEQSIGEWPDSVYAHSGKDVIRKLKSRRDRIHAYAKDYYLSLSKEVDVVGSDKQELFELQRYRNNDLEVKVRKISKSGKTDKVIYHRTFTREETKEVRLYGLGGEDVFQLKGNSQNGIKVRVIGGEGKDKIIDDSNDGRLFKRGVLVYDEKKNTELTKGTDTRSLLSNNPTVNAYDRKAFKYNTTIPLVFAGFNQVDKLIMGGGFLATRYAFRKDPFSSKHLLMGGISPFTAGNRLIYQGDFTELFGPFGVDVRLDANFPTYVSTFAGLGNENEYSDVNDIFYQLNQNKVIATALLTRVFGQKKQTQLGFGLDYNFGDVDRDRNGDRFINQFAEENNREEEIYRSYHYAGLQLGFEADARNRVFLPLFGAYFKTAITAYTSLDKEAPDPYVNWNAKGALYYTLRMPAHLTFILRGGAAANFGDYAYLMSNRVGGNQTIRGYRKDRFWGRYYAYSNVETRLEAFRIRWPWLKAPGGFIAFWDAGRVWQDNESSNKLHHGFGGGFYFLPFNITALSFTAGFSEEENLMIMISGGLKL